MKINNKKFVKFVNFRVDKSIRILYNEYTIKVIERLQSWKTPAKNGEIYIRKTLALSREIYIRKTLALSREI